MSRPGAHRLQRWGFTTIVPAAMIITYSKRHRGGFQPDDAVSFYALVWRARRQSPKISSSFSFRRNIARRFLMPRSARSTKLMRCSFVTRIGKAAANPRHNQDRSKRRSTKNVATRWRPAQLPAIQARRASENSQLIQWNSGAAYVTRTRDPIITNDVLYRLS